MPAPSTTTAQNINTELGQSTTTSVNLNETKVRNLACKSSGQISYGDCRWGINFPGGAQNALIYIKDYTTDSTLYINASDLTFSPTEASASITLQINSSGTMTFSASTSSSSNSTSVTWLTSGSAGDYTAQLNVTLGDTPSGSAINTDLALSTTRSWSFSVSTGFFPTLVIKECFGNLIIKDSGGTLITRPIYFQVVAESQP